MSIVHRKLKKAQQNRRDLALRVYCVPKTYTSTTGWKIPSNSVDCTQETEQAEQEVGDQALHVYCALETETKATKCGRPGTRCLRYTLNLQQTATALQLSLCASIASLSLHIDLSVKYTV